ncbi:hypothetical protein A3B21_04120 [Candidatus Uhrbacteria bacterium RIFCSPLOWO2_01_FULL_47_24]|uniref:Glycosyl transferase n=1 Tax=Candidatus Uhrbacteria bacterium RIFCSPLOWO2_01_FULL_47_24 TaxID=1802401 RepID=A0A1F7UV85_9BACT|nr:MAG: hypothetical protein A2753_02435 [Candidatus Uhrbacteria bacterium RIFCSPHIGHO2_01_FULL_47_11]OGL68772.1 MAG: hypothetical protein A3D58_01325 [Candidatus Uhrbacteria bacterium RIFCSPHIGHO2_02_FULL_46_47]OGL76799.1 MAG: hypothetical protein A3F52_01885 [Candidatus Uhrbacteria bacterium RIFCSPHIGHO2_12_FULL_47_11]OGL81577.1 MAG: hypothetical protein A3B21_04120 [Candidatus Uhrbacteria bacterium RIFCSPLOWO2_01_FULL_47_24]OGL83959.1 MAG: hypothetical protein A3J03_00885 [Candidatus Uhrbact
MIVIIIGFVTFLISLFFVWLTGNLAYRFGFVSTPSVTRWNKRPVALFGGVGIFCAFILGLFFFYMLVGRPAQIQLVLALLLGASAMFGLGLIDDVLHLKPSTKLIGQIIGVSIPLVAGFVFSASPWHLLNILITFFWFLMIINAINLMDNMDGLASGIVMIATVTFLGVRFIKDGFALSDPIFPIAVIFLYATAGFWIVNRYPASIFMGDAGSLFVGFLLAGITMPSALNGFLGSSSAVLSLLVPLVVLSVPLFDTLLVTVSRLWNGISPTEGGKDHSSHRLVGLGFTENRAVWLLYGLAALGGVAAVVLARFPVYSVAALLFYVLFLIIVGIYLSRVKVYSQTKAPDNKVRWTPLTNNILYKRHAFEVLLDFVLIVASYYLAYYLRFEGALKDNLGLYIQSLPIIVASCAVGFYIAGVYRGLWHFITTADLGRFAGGVLSGVGIGVFLIAVLYRFEGYSRAVFIILGILLFLLVVGSRLSFRLVDELIRRRADAVKTKNVVIYGAGQSGKFLLEEWTRNPTYAEYRILGFIDDDPSKQHRMLGGLSIQALNEFVQETQTHPAILHEVWISSNHIASDQIRNLMAGVVRENRTKPRVRRFTLNMEETVEQS